MIQNLHYNLDMDRFVLSSASVTPVTALNLKLLREDTLRIRFYRGGIAEQIAAPGALSVGIKQTASDTEWLSRTIGASLSGSGQSAVYSIDLLPDSSALRTLLGSDEAKTVRFELSFDDRLSMVMDASVDNTLHRGTEDPPDLVDNYLTEAESDARYLAFAYDALAPSDAGNSNISKRNTKVTADAGAGAYIHTLTCPVTGIVAGDELLLLLELPASANPTIELRNATAGGTLLHSQTGNATISEYVSIRLVFNGTAWEKHDAHHIL